MRTKDLIAGLQYIVDTWESGDYKVMTHNKDGELVPALSIAQDHDTKELHISVE